MREKYDFKRTEINRDKADKDSHKERVMYYDLGREERERKEKKKDSYKRARLRERNEREIEKRERELEKQEEKSKREHTFTNILERVHPRKYSPIEIGLRQKEEDKKRKRKEKEKELNEASKREWGRTHKKRKSITWRLRHT